MKFKYAILLLIFPLFLSGLTLKEAENYALRNNKEIQISQSDKAGTNANYLSVKGSIYPQLSLMGSYGIKKTDVPEILPAGVMAEEEMPLNTVLSMSQILFSSDVFNGLRAAKVYTKINDTMLRVTETEILFKTKELFNTCLLTEQVVNIQREALQIAQSHFEQISVMFDQGLVSEYDLLKAELQVSQLEPQLQEAINNHSMSIEALKNHLGGNIEITSIDGELVEPEIAEYDLNEAISEGKNNRLELKATSLNADILNIQYKNQQKSYLPTVALNASVTNFTSTSDYSVEADNFGNIYQLSVDFQVPLFTGFTNRSKTRKFKQEWISAQISNDKLEDDISLEITNYYLKLEKEVKNLTAVKKNRALATKGLTIAEQRYSNQLATYLEVQDAQLSYKLAQLDYISAIYNVINTKNSLVKAMGKNLKS